MIQRRFEIGERIRVTFWAIPRERDWMYGNVTSEPVDCYGVMVQKVKWDAGYETVVPNALICTLTEAKELSQ